MCVNYIYSRGVLHRTRSCSYCLLFLQPSCMGFPELFKAFIWIYTCIDLSLFSGWRLVFKESRVVVTSVLVLSAGLQCDDEQLCMTKEWVSIE